MPRTRDSGLRVLVLGKAHLAKLNLAEDDLDAKGVNLNRPLDGRPLTPLLPSPLHKCRLVAVNFVIQRPRDCTLALDHAGDGLCSLARQAPQGAPLPLVRRLLPVT